MQEGMRLLLYGREPFHSFAKGTGRCSKGSPSYAMAKHAVLTSSSLGRQFV